MSECVVEGGVSVAKSVLGLVCVCEVFCVESRRGAVIDRSIRDLSEVKDMISHQEDHHIEAFT